MTTIESLIAVARRCIGNDARLTKARWFTGVACCVVVSVSAMTQKSFADKKESGPISEPALNMVVMDPLALPLSCACVKGVGQRKYDLLAKHIAAEVGRPVHLIYEESLHLANRRGLPSVDLVIGKRSMVLHDAMATKMHLHTTATLIDQAGSTEYPGVVLVAKDSLIQSLKDLQGKKVGLGSAEHAECHQLAKQLFAAQGVESELIEFNSVESAVYAFADQEVSAVVVPNYLPPLLEGCGKLGKGESRIVCETTPATGVQAFLADHLDTDTQMKIAAALRTAGDDPLIELALESRGGFQMLAETPLVATKTVHTDLGWPDWRGLDRDGQSLQLPDAFGEKAPILWHADATGPAMAGISATSTHVLVADKSEDGKQDIFRALDAKTGKPIWTIQENAPGRMDYTNSPRATPVISGNHVLLQSVFGQLWCVDLHTGQVRWKRHLVTDLQGELPTWGYCVPPLVLNDHKVIIAPGGAETSVVAIDLESGATIWKSPGHAAAYAPFVFGNYGGRDQIIGYDSAGLGGWDAKTGKRLWELIPPENSDFHVATPVKFREGLILATENNGTRYYRFDAQGKILVKPSMVNLDCAPDTCTPVVVSEGKNELIFCSAYGELFCLDGSDELKTVWTEPDDRFYDHTCLIGGNNRVLLWSTDCDLLLIDASASQMKIVSNWNPMDGKNPESMSHPAIVGNHLFLRSQSQILCVEMPSIKPRILNSSN